MDGWTYTTCLRCVWLRFPRYDAVHAIIITIVVVIVIVIITELRRDRIRKQRARCPLANDRE